MLTPSVLTGGAVAVVLGLAACSSGGGQGEGVRSPGPAQRGGTLHVLDEGTVLSWDPQRVYSSSDMSVANRLFSRTLTTFAPGTTRDQQRTLVPDLARDTGTTGDGGRTWSFVLRAGAAWQDGRPVTCADVKYGISRQFAVDRLQGGPQYGLRYLDIPRNPNGSSRYAGPYRKTGQALFDKAVSCRGNTLGVRLNQPLPDFNRMVSLPAFSPFRADHDQGSGSNLEVFSNGPYMLKGAWKPGTGGVFVRNPHWDAAQDPIRKAYPDQVAFTEGLDTQQVVQRLVADRGDDAAAVTHTSVPPAAVESALSAPGVRSRSTNPLSPLVEYLAPNLKSPSMANFKARQALAMSTDRTAYVQAMGGTRTAVPTTAVISQTLDAYRSFDPFGVGLSGDPKRAKVLLQQSGLASPVPLRVVYRKGILRDRAMAALKARWEQAGFTVTLIPLDSRYTTTVNQAAYANRADVFWGLWEADFGSALTMIPPLFDSRVNLSAAGSGQDLGYVNNPALNARMDAAARVRDDAARARAWGDLDETIARLAGSVALVNQRSMFLHGSAVKNYSDHELLGGSVDLAQLAVR
jgi:peptide/nickel transport system substrate-binding protein